MSTKPDEKPSLALSWAHMRAQQRGKCYSPSSSALDHFDIRPRDHRVRAVGELDLHHTDAAFRGNHLQVRRQAHDLPDPPEEWGPEDAHRIADLDPTPGLAPWAGFDLLDLFAGRQRHDDFRTDDPRTDLRRAGDGRLASLQLPQQLKGPVGHRDAPEPFGQDQGKTDGFRSGDGHAEVVTQQRPQVLVVHPADDDPLDADGFGPREGLGSDKGPAHHDLPGMGGREVRRRHILLRRRDPQDQAPPGLTADPEDPLYEGARGLDP